MTFTLYSNSKILWFHQLSNSYMGCYASTGIIKVLVKLLLFYRPRELIKL